MINRINFINEKVGQNIENKLDLNYNLEVDLNDKYITFKDFTTNEICLRFFLEDCLIKYQFYQSGDWAVAQSLTSPTISHNDSNILPHNGSSNHILIDPNGLSVFTNNFKCFQTNSYTTSIKSNQLDLGEASILFSGLSAQTLKLQSAEKIIMQFNNLEIKCNQLPILGVSASTDLTSAVNLQQLKNYKPQALQIINDSIRMLAQSGQTLIYVTPTQLFSNIKLSYTTDFQQFEDEDLVNAKYVKQQLQTLLSQPNGLAVLDECAKIPYSSLYPNITYLKDNKLQTLANFQIYTDNVQEGIQNLYYTNQRVNQLIQSLQGIPNGLVQLNALSKIPTQYLPGIVESGNYYNGQDSNKINPFQYTTNIPVVGDKYITTDTNLIYILTQPVYTNPLNWVQILQQPQTISVNGLSGIVALNTNNVPETPQNLYFQTGIFDYLQNMSNSPYNLLKLNQNAFIPSSVLSNILVLNQGTFEIYDDQLCSLTFRSIQDQKNILSLDFSQIICHVPILYDQPVTITQDRQLVDKWYVDHLTTIKTGNTNVSVYPQQITASVDGIQQLQIDTTGIYSYKPIHYNQGVVIENDNELVPKQYVDDLLQQYFQTLGSKRQYLTISTNTAITQIGTLTNFIVYNQSTVNNDITFIQSNSVALSAGKYNGFVVVQFFSDPNDPLTITVFNQNQEPLCTFPSNTHSQTNSFFLDLIQPDIITLSIDNISQINFIRLHIQEFVSDTLTIGLDNIHDTPTSLTKIQTLQNGISVKVKDIPYLQIDDSTIEVSQNIKLLLNQQDFAGSTEVVNKGYVDNLFNQPFSISKLGQIAQFAIAYDQITNLYSGGIIKFDTTVVNTANNIQLDALNHIFTLQTSYVYQIAYQINIRYQVQPTAIIFTLVDLNSQTEVQHSQYQIQTNLTDNNQDSVQFLLDLRSLTSTSTRQYQMKIKAIETGGISRINNKYTKLTILQVQEMSNLQQNIIQNAVGSTFVKIDGDNIAIRIAGNDLLKISKDVDGSVQVSNNADDNLFKILNTPEIVIQQSTTLDPSIQIQQQQQIVTKKYVDDSFVKLAQSGLIPVQFVPDITPIGLIVAFQGSTAPANWLICNGTTFDQLIYPELYTFLGSINILPDLRGQFLRGLDTTGTVDLNGTTRVLGDNQGDTLKYHNHEGQTQMSANQTIYISGDTNDTSVVIRGNNSNGSDSTQVFEYDNDSGSNGSVQQASIHSHSFNTTAIVPGHQHPISQSGNSFETRPKNVSVNYIIKAKRDSIANTTAQNFNQILSNDNTVKLSANMLQQLVCDINGVILLLLDQQRLQVGVPMTYSSPMIFSQDQDVPNKMYVDKMVKDCIDAYSVQQVVSNGTINQFIAQYTSNVFNHIQFNTLDGLLTLQPGTYKFDMRFQVQSNTNLQSLFKIDLLNINTLTSILPHGQFLSMSTYSIQQLLITNSVVLTFNTVQQCQFKFTAQNLGTLINSNIRVVNK